MELFLYGLLAGIALGMWLAILLYTVAHKRRHGWSLRRKQKQAEQTPASQTAQNEQASNKSARAAPADDFDEEYYLQQFPDAQPVATPSDSPEPPAESAPPPAAAMPAAKLTANVAENADVAVVYTGKSSEADEVRQSDEDDAYQRLVSKMEGDVEATERLIEYERERAPAAPRQNLIQNALDRLQYGQQ